MYVLHIWVLGPLGHGFAGLFWFLVFSLDVCPRACLGVPSGVGGRGAQGKFNIREPVLAILLFTGPSF